MIKERLPGGFNLEEVRVSIGKYRLQRVGLIMSWRKNRIYQVQCI